MFRVGYWNDNGTIKPVEIAYKDIGTIRGFYDQAKQILRKEGGVLKKHPTFNPEHFLKVDFTTPGDGDLPQGKPVPKDYMVWGSDRSFDISSMSKISPVRDERGCKTIRPGVGLGLMSETHFYMNRVFKGGALGSLWTQWMEKFSYHVIRLTVDMTISKKPASKMNDILYVWDYTPSSTVFLFNMLLDYETGVLKVDVRGDGGNHVGTHEASTPLVKGVMNNIVLWLDCNTGSAPNKSTFGIYSEDTGRMIVEAEFDNYPGASKDVSDLRAPVIYLGAHYNTADYRSRWNLKDSFFTVSQTGNNKQNILDYINWHSSTPSIPTDDASNFYTIFQNYFFGGSSIKAGNRVNPFFGNNDGGNNVSYTMQCYNGPFDVAYYWLTGKWLNEGGYVPAQTLETAMSCFLGSRTDYVNVQLYETSSNLMVMDRTQASAKLLNFNSPTEKEGAILRHADIAFTGTLDEFFEVKKVNKNLNKQNVPTEIDIHVANVHVATLDLTKMDIDLEVPDYTLKIGGIVGYGPNVPFGSFVFNMDLSKIGADQTETNILYEFADGGASMVAAGGVYNNGSTGSQVYGTSNVNTDVMAIGSDRLTEIFKRYDKTKPSFTNLCGVRILLGKIYEESSGFVKLMKAVRNPLCVKDNYLDLTKMNTKDNTEIVVRCHNYNYANTNTSYTGELTLRLIVALVANED